MKIVQKFARQVAAIDESLLSECPQADKTWANHIGYALILTFVVVFGLVFYSLMTIDGAKVIFDMQTNAVKMESNSHNLWSYIRFGAVATVIALVIFLFDRTFYQFAYLYCILKLTISKFFLFPRFANYISQPNSNNYNN